MSNEFIEYYGEHNISPVHQDISDFEIHYGRRRKLYRQCGIPLQTFKNAKVLEVGPGSGYNTLATLKFISGGFSRRTQSARKGRYKKIIRGI